MSTLLEKRLLLPGLLIALAWLASAGIGAWKNGSGGDAVRQWVVCQYVRAGINPYALAKETLEAKYGAAHESKAKIFSIPRQVPPYLASRVLPEYGPPEATYPPSAIGLFGLLIGWLPSPGAVLAVWLGVNLLALIAAVLLVPRLLPRSPLRWRIVGPMEAAGLIFVFSPFFIAVTASQFSVLALAGLLIGCHRKAGDAAAGISLAVAMIKPSIALPFLLIPLFQARWRPLLLMAAIHGLAMASVCLAVGASPMALLREWLAVSRYFLQGMYSIQEIINVLDWRPAGPLLSGLALVLIGGLRLLSRQAPAAYYFAFLGVASMFWTYHGPYDFVCLLPALMILMGWKPSEVSELPASKMSVLPAPAMGAGCFLLLTLAMMPPIYEGGGLTTRLLRWGGRVAFLYVLLAMGYLLWRRRQ